MISDRIMRFMYHWATFYPGTFENQDWYTGGTCLSGVIFSLKLLCNSGMSFRRFDSTRLGLIILVWLCSLAV